MHVCLGGLIVSTFRQRLYLLLLLLSLRYVALGQVIVQFYCTSALLCARYRALSFPSFRMSLVRQGRAAGSRGRGNRSILFPPPAVGSWQRRRARIERLRLNNNKKVENVIVIFSSHFRVTLCRLALTWYAPTSTRVVAAVPLFLPLTPSHFSNLEKKNIFLPMSWHCWIDAHLSRREFDWCSAKRKKKWCQMSPPRSRKHTHAQRYGAPVKSMRLSVENSSLSFFQLLALLN